MKIMFIWHIALFILLVDIHLFHMNMQNGLSPIEKNDIEKELLKVFQWLDDDEKILHIYSNREIISKFADYDIDDTDLYNIYISHDY